MMKENIESSIKTTEEILMLLEAFYSVNVSLSLVFNSSDKLSTFDLIQ